MAMKTSAKIMKMVRARDFDDGYPIEDDFSIEEIEVLELCLKKYEGETIAQSNPYPTGQLSWAVCVPLRISVVNNLEGQILITLRPMSGLDRSSRPAN